MRLYFRLANKRVRENAVAAIRAAPDGAIVSIREATRTLEQNAHMWALLTELSRQIAWDGEHLTESEWKDLLTACLRKQKVVRGIEGGLVFLGSRTSNMSKREMADLIELIYAFAAERGVILGTVDA
jgi:cobyric acid synthase